MNEDKELYVRRAKCDLQRAMNAVEDALNNMRQASDLGVVDLYQVQEFSRKAERVLEDSVNGVDKLAKWNKLSI